MLSGLSRLVQSVVPEVNENASEVTHNVVGPTEVGRHPNLWKRLGFMEPLIVRGDNRLFRVDLCLTLWFRISCLPFDTTPGRSLTSSPNRYACNGQLQ